VLFFQFFLTPQKIDFWILNFFPLLFKFLKPSLLLSISEKKKTNCCVSSPFLLLSQNRMEQTSPLSCACNECIASSWLEKNGFSQVKCSTPGCSNKDIHMFAKGDSRRLRCPCTCRQHRVTVKPSELTGIPVFRCKNCDVCVPFLNSEQKFATATPRLIESETYCCSFCRSSEGQFDGLVPRQFAEALLTAAAEALTARLRDHKKSLSLLFLTQ
jgi:hypothetical protein